METKRHEESGIIFEQWLCGSIYSILNQAFITTKYESNPLLHTLLPNAYGVQAYIIFHFAQ